MSQHSNMLPLQPLSFLSLSLAGTRGRTTSLVAGPDSSGQASDPPTTMAPQVEAPDVEMMGHEMSRNTGNEVTARNGRVDWDKSNAVAKKNDSELTLPSPTSAMSQASSMPPPPLPLHLIARARSSKTIITAMSKRVRAANIHAPPPSFTPAPTRGSRGYMKLKIGQQVYLLDKKGNSILWSDLNRSGAAADASAIDMQTSSSPASASELLAYSNVFVIQGRFRRVDGANSPGTFYKVVAQDGSGRGGRFVPACRRVLRVRFRPGDCAIYHRDQAEQQKRAQGKFSNIRHHKKKFLAVVVKANVLRGKRLYHIYVPSLRRNILLSDARLEELDRNRDRL